MTDEQIARLAAGLTKAQRTAIVTAQWYKARNAYNPAGFYVHADMRVRRALAEAGIIRDYLNPHQRLTPLGLAVRAHLTKEQTDAG